MIQSLNRVPPARSGGSASPEGDGGELSAQDTPGIPLGNLFPPTWAGLDGFPTCLCFPAPVELPLKWSAQGRAARLSPAVFIQTSAITMGDLRASA